VLYERGHAELIEGVISRHASDNAQVLITDPGRGNSARFTRLMDEQGYSLEESRCPMDDQDAPPHRGRMLHYRRGTAGVVVA